MPHAGRTLFQLSFPMFLSSLLTFATMLVDMAILSAYSANAAASVAIARQVLQIALETSTMIGIGAVILISYRLGRADEADAQRIAVVAVVANGAFCFGVGVLLAVLGPLLMWLLDTPAELMADACAYLFILAAAMLFHGIGSAAMACLRAFGKGRTILVIGVATVLLFLATEYVLVLGMGPIPAMGVWGAAWSAFLLRLATAALFGIALLRTVGFRFGRSELKEWRGSVRRMLALAFPSVSDYIAYGFYQLILLGFVTAFGVSNVLARTYVLIANAFLILVVMAVSQGNEVLLGYRRGEGRPDLAYAQALRSSLIAAGLTTALATLLWLGAEFFLGLFASQSEVVAIAQRLLLLTIFIQPGFAFNTILLQALRAVGDVRRPVFVSMSVTFGIGLPLAWLLCVAAGLGVEGVWVAMFVEETLKAGYMLRRWRARQWTQHELG